MGVILMCAMRKTQFCWYFVEVKLDKIYSFVRKRITK
jgi:hypothetical protein